MIAGRLELLLLLLLPLVRNTCNSFDHIKNLHRGIPKPEKTTQAPLVYLNAHSCVYNKCLIVISRRDTIERRGAKKGKVWRTGLRQRWTLGIPPTRRHPLNDRRRGSCQKVLGFRWSRCYKHSKRRTA